MSNKIKNEILSPDQEEKVDSFYDIGLKTLGLEDGRVRLYGKCLNNIIQDKNFDALSVLKGGIFAIGTEDSNTDWMCHCACSMREIYYKRLDNKIEGFKSLNLPFDKSDLTTLHYCFTYWCHHQHEGIKSYQNKLQIKKLQQEEGKESFINYDLLADGTKESLYHAVERFFYLLSRIEKHIGVAQMTQLQLHREIELLASRNAIDTSPDDVRDLISRNPDARAYFFSKASEEWLIWLWENGFLDPVKKAAENPDAYQMSISEISYLMRAATTAPSEVTNIILEIPLSAKETNRLLDQFEYIASKLPAENLARLMPKIYRERWVSHARKSGYFNLEYQNMLTTLAEARDHENLLMLAEVVLALPRREEIESDAYSFNADNPFCFDDLSDMGFFNYLVDVEDLFAEKALSLLCVTLEKVIYLNESNDETGTFEIDDEFSLPMMGEIDLFNLGNKNIPYDRRNICFLLITIIKFVKRLIKKSDATSQNVRHIYAKHINRLPDSKATWRLRLYVLTLRPDIFEKELCDAFFRPFGVEKSAIFYKEFRQKQELIGGAEYLTALQKCFSVLPQTEQKKFIAEVISYYGKNSDDEREQRALRHYGSRILCSIAKNLGQFPDLSQEITNAFGDHPSQEFQPNPERRSIYDTSFKVGMPMGPVSKKEFGSLTVKKIAQNLKTDWRPENLHGHYENESTIWETSIEGVINLLESDILERPQEYVDNATLFFAPDTSLHLQYTRAYLHGIIKAIENCREHGTTIKWKNVIDLCINMTKAHADNPSSWEKEQNTPDGRWWASWNHVLTEAASVVEEMLKEKNGSMAIDFKLYRGDIFNILRYISTKISRQHDVFQAFWLFISRDYKIGGRSDMADDVKNLCEDILLKQEKSEDFAYNFGRCLQNFYYWDSNWTATILSDMFSQKNDKKSMYTSICSGYLDNRTVYRDLFFRPEIQKLYSFALSLKEPDNADSELVYKNMNERLAEHLGVAYAGLEKFSIEHPLLSEFLAICRPQKHAEFIEFLGKEFIYHGHFDENKSSKWYSDRFRAVWDRMLEKYSGEKDKTPLFEFSLWLDLNGRIFDAKSLTQHLVKTLKITDGRINNFYMQGKRLYRLAEQSPQNSLKILRLYWLKGVIGHDNRSYFHLDDEWERVFTLLYNKDETKEGTEALISDLIEKGGQPFWKLKNILK